MDWSVEDTHKEFTLFRSLAKVWLESKGIPDNKHMLILQLLGKGGSLPLRIFSLHSLQQ